MEKGSSASLSRYFKTSLLEYQRAVKAAKTQFLSNLVSSNSHKPQFLFNTLNSLINPCESTHIVPSPTLCEQFLKYFHERIAVVRLFPSPLVFDPAASPICPVVFENFAQVSLPFLTDIVKHLRPSYCPLDIIPPHLLKDVFSTFGSCIVDLINPSLSSCL